MQSTSQKSTPKLVSPPYAVSLQSGKNKTHLVSKKKEKKCTFRPNLEILFGRLTEWDAHHLVAEQLIECDSQWNTT